MADKYYHDKIKKVRNCKANTNYGHKCQQKAVVDGYCLVHLKRDFHFGKGAENGKQQSNKKL